MLISRVNDRSRSFTITVLKIDSEPTAREQIKLAFSKLEFSNEVDENFYLASELDGFVYTKQY